ncbi:UNKNOWN [Stylonychia lemnae]|uniref:Uncharacterized protein n=1 Tax=Stylonychia lemnae TaxID=5949 RepID=A0A077ZU38_STYLE|nr:UNKNOWN [Stylonychia lemnae]|eukprot:CDW71976.1 UNKNOWN [Stylonychia lemnae]
MNKIWIVALIEAILVLIYCTYLAQQYAAKDRTPLYVKALTVIGWFFGLTIIMLVPLDIYTVKVNGEVDDFLVVWWYVIYWAVFLMNWFILPFLIEYLGAADFTVKERIMRSIRNNVPMLVVYLVLFIIVIIILAVTKSGREALENEGIVGCIIGLSLVFGLLSIVILLGYGLVKIPISYFKFASNYKKLRHYQQKAAEYEGQHRAKIQKVQDMINIGYMIKVKNELELYRKVIIEDIDSFCKQIEEIGGLNMQYNPRNKLKMPSDFKGFIDYNKLVRYRNKFRQESTDLSRLTSFRGENIEKAILTQDIIDSKGQWAIQSILLKQRGNSKLQKTIKLIMYIVVASNYGLFQLKVSNIYALHKNKQTDSPCLLYSCLFMMRLGVPICYNFLILTQMEDAAVYRVMGPVRYVQFLGTHFNQWVFPVCRFLSCIGLKQYAFDSEFAEERAEEGKYIIERQRQEKYSFSSTINGNSSALDEESKVQKQLLFAKQTLLESLQRKNQNYSEIPPRRLKQTAEAKALQIKVISLKISSQPMNKRELRVFNKAVILVGNISLVSTQTMKMKYKKQALKVYLIKYSRKRSEEASYNEIRAST